MPMPLNSFRSGPTAGVAIDTRPVGVVVFVLAGGSANATAQIYDNTAATGNPIMSINTLINDTRDVEMFGYLTNIGLYAVVTGTGAVMTVLYE
jgi:hypothetical protein